MGIYTCTGLVRHAEKALALNTKYMWGGILRPVEQQYDMLKKIYGGQSGTGYSAARWNELRELFGKGFFGVDCIGLIKSYYWSGKPDGGTGSPQYGAAGFPDVNAGYMFRTAKIKGDIKDMPDTPGLIVYSKSHPHVGIYIGGGETVESTLGERGDGVVKRKLDGFWEYWFECPYIEYPKKKAYTKPHFRTGDKVYIKTTAVNYAGTNIAIPSQLKGRHRSFTVAKILDGRALVKELFSWVNTGDIAKIQ